MNKFIEYEIKMVIQVLQSDEVTETEIKTEIERLINSSDYLYMSSSIHTHKRG